MIQLIKKLDSSLLEVQPILEYLSQFREYIIASEDVEVDNGEIDILSEGELIKIMFMEINEGKWWSIYRYHSDGMRYEQIDAMIYNRIKEKGYNRVIKFSGHLEDDDYSYITCSGFSLLNNEVVESWKEYRVVPIHDLPKIQYSKSMNLTELICMTDDKSSHILRKENEKNIRVCK